MRVLTCGSVDHGKSTLIGRLLYDANLLMDDQIAMLKKNNMDFSCLLDGLEDERKQSITIDVAYRYFTTPKRKFIFIDAPGHQQYTRNMATGASQANLALVLCDITEGLTEQTKKHVDILKRMGIKNIIVCVNKMDLVDYDEKVFNQLQNKFQTIIDKQNVAFIPVSALRGENIVHRSEQMSWYQGKTLFDALEHYPNDQKNRNQKFCLPIQYVKHRNYSGHILGGNLDNVKNLVHLPSKQSVSIKNVLLETDDAVTITLNEEIDIGRGDILMEADFPCRMANQCVADIIAFDEPLENKKEYFFKCGHHLTMGTIDNKKVYFNKPISLGVFDDGWFLGSFIIIDRITKNTIAVGMIQQVIDQDIYPYQLSLSAKERALQKNQKPMMIWFTGISGVGKSSLANALDQRLFALGYHTYLLDGDNVRSGLCGELKFTDQDRKENIRRIWEVGKLMVDAGLITIVAAIAPFREQRDGFKDEQFIEVFLDAPLAICKERDPKQLYKNGVIADNVYEPPLKPDIHIHTDQISIEDATREILHIILEKQLRGDK